MDELKKNQIYSAKITGYTSEGAGVCRVLGRVVFVKGALKGELWEILILKVTASAVYGKGLRLLEASTFRVEPSCPVFGLCGGCDLLHMQYEEELRFKLDRVNKAFTRLGGLDFSISEIIGADPEHQFAYRNKAIFAVGQDEKGKAVTGFFRPRSHELIPAPGCLIQTEFSLRCAAALRAFMDKHGISAYDETSGKGQIRHIFTRCGMKTGQSVACIVAARGLGGHTEALVKALRSACPELTGIVLCVNKTRGNTVLAGDFYTLWGGEMIEDILCGLKFRISPLSFFQINPPQAERLYARAMDYVGNAETVLDLYCGAGTISLCLAKGAKQVYGAEIVEAAVENARENARRNGIKNVEFLLGDAAEAAKILAGRGIRPDAVVVDPPRKGLSEELMHEIARMSPDKVVYVSCNPASLARDLKRFAQLGYPPAAGTALDMFPQTAHVETVVLITKKND